MGFWDMYRSRGGIIASAAVVQLISSICIGLRFYTRFWKHQEILASDWLVLGAFICATGLSAMEIYGVVANAFAVPLNTTSPVSQGKSERLATVQHMEYAFVIVGVVSLGLVKLSVSLLYWHIFSRVKFRRFLIFWIVVLISWTLTFVLAELLECGTRPLKVFGSRHDIETYCPHIHEIGYALVGSDVGTDLVTLLIPIPLVMGMRLPTARKVLVTATFLIGLLAVAASTAKAYIFIAGTLAYLKEDGIILVTAYSMWNLAEIHVGIIAACGMTLRPILGRIFPTDMFLRFVRSFTSLQSGSNSKDRRADLPSFVQMESLSNSQSERRPHNEKTEEQEREKKQRQRNMLFQTSALPEVR